MTTERDRSTRVVLSWLREDTHENAERVLLLALDEVDTTPQRRSWWPARRFSDMNKLALTAAAAAAVLVIAVVGYNLLPGLGVGGPSPTPSPSPSPLAVGSFISHGGQIELDATGEGSNVTGSMTYTDVNGAEIGHFAVDLACTRTTESGLIMIGGPTTDSTNVDDYAPVGSNVALVLERGSPVKAVIWFEYPDPQASCPAFLESIPDGPDSAFEPAALEPIDGTLELAP